MSDLVKVACFMVALAVINYVVFMTVGLVIVVLDYVILGQTEVSASTPVVAAWFCGALTVFIIERFEYV